MDIQLRNYLRSIAAKGGSQKTEAQQRARRENAAKATEARKTKAAVDNKSRS